MKKNTTTVTGPTGTLQAQSLNLDDRSSWYCMLHERGEVLLEQKAATTPKAMRET
jgi:hypothetical protein